MKTVIISVILALFGCDKGSTSKVSEAMDWLNDPKGVPGGNGALIYQVDQLPQSGASYQSVWPGSWYPYSQGGTVNATQKYSQLTGDYRAVNWERSESDRLRGYNWAGHCNGYSAASTMEQEPKSNVNMNGLIFYVDDIKGLLAEAWQGGGSIVGGRCNNDNVTRDANGRLQDSACRDLNPATMHIIMTNFLGRWHKPVIMDNDASSNVWNYPVVNYRIAYQQNITKRDANYWLRGVNEDYYPYNDKIVSLKYMQMEIIYSTGYKPTYEYILELDGAGNILGGEWYRDSRYNHPDFVWRHTQPTAENPYLNINVIYDIYRRSK